MTDNKIDNSAINEVDGFINYSNGNLHQNRINCGWKILVEWKDGSFYWAPLKDLRQSNPVELDEYSVVNEIIYEPAFSWFVKEILRCPYMNISRVKSKYWCTPHKFGIRVPKTVKEEYYIDRQSGTDFWTKTI